MGCRGESSTFRADAVPLDTEDRPERSISSFDDRVSSVLPGEFDGHRLDSAILALTPDGTFRVTVELAPHRKLILAAGEGKETLLARGWLIEGEQHYEKAILVRLRKGGSVSRPASRRETWWIQATNQLIVCDAVASQPGFERLGEELRALCKSVTVQAERGATPAPP